MFWHAAYLLALEIINMECPYCLKKVNPNGQTRLECPDCKSEIFLSEDGYLDRAIRFKGASPKSTWIILFAFIILVAFFIIFGEGINSKYFPMTYFFFIGILFTNYFILACKYKEVGIGPAYISDESNPDSFSLFVGLIAIVSIVGFVTGIIEIFKKNIF